jgi:hypothetical protein
LVEHRFAGRNRSQAEIARSLSDAHELHACIGKLHDDESAVVSLYNRTEQPRPRRLHARTLLQDRR